MAGADKLSVLGETWCRTSLLFIQSPGRVEVITDFKFERGSDVLGPRVGEYGVTREVGGGTPPFKSLLEIG